MKVKLDVQVGDREVVVVKPNAKINHEAHLQHMKAFREAVDNKALLRAKLDDYIRELKLWDDEKEQEFKRLRSIINDGELSLKKGGIKLSDARQKALEMKNARSALRKLMYERSMIDSNTAEGQADNARFNYMVYACVVYNDTGERYFKTYDEYLNATEDPVALLGASTLANMLYGVDGDAEKRLPENKFLFEWNFIDEKMRLVDKQGRLINEDGRLIDEDGYFIDENGQRIDENGVPLNSEGSYEVESQPFLDDDGNPISK